MKGLILSAGKGTRLQPFSYTQPKTFLPVANKPVIQYCVEKLVDIGITDIGIVIHPSLTQQFHELLGSGDQLGVSISYINQQEQKGIADAVKCAESFVNHEPFILLLGDNLIQESLWQLNQPVENKVANASIMLARVDNPQDFGVAEIKGQKIIGIQEKPKHPKSNMAVIGAYAFDSSIFKAVHAISPSARGEYEITDAIQWLIDQDCKVTYSKTDKHYSDVGTTDRWLEANRWMLDQLGNDKERSSRSHIEKCTIIPPVEIGDNCHLENCVIGPYVSIANKARVIQCNMKNSIVLEGAELTNINNINRSIFGKDSIAAGSLKDDKSAEFILGDKCSVVNSNGNYRRSSDESK